MKEQGEESGTWTHEIQLEVRDYELDIQGIVNNSVYQNYLEHARHRLLKAIGLDFAELHARGTDAIVTRAEIDYRASLRSGDGFVVLSRVLAHGRLRFIFNQEIRRLPDRELCVEARIVAATLVNGRPAPSEEIRLALERAQRPKRSSS
ncbi:MAG TPA: acyl-CoA thioesterase [Rectinemataceae bacterium]|nr:acyl-CoA thioesterase [Rectinemataceae bacterium]